MTLVTDQIEQSDKRWRNSWVDVSMTCSSRTSCSGFSLLHACVGSCGEATCGSSGYMCTIWKRRWSRELEVLVRWWHDCNISTSLHLFISVFSYYNLKNQKQRWVEILLTQCERHVWPLVLMMVPSCQHCNWLFHLLCSSLWDAGSSFVSSLTVKLNRIELWIHNTELE